MTGSERALPPNVVAFVRCKHCNECGVIRDGIGPRHVQRRYPQNAWPECDQHWWVRDDD